jgi:hypothetical protein
MEDLPQPRETGPICGRDSFGNPRAKPLVDHLPGEVDVGPILNVTTCDKPNFEME